MQRPKASIDWVVFPTTAARYSHRLPQNHSPARKLPDTSFISENSKKNICILIVQHGQFRKSKVVYRRASYIKLPLSDLLEFERSLGPVIATVVTVKLSQAAVVKLGVKPEVFSVIPLDHSKLVARSDGLDDRCTTPRSGVLGENNLALKIVPVDLKLHIAEDDSSNRGLISCFSRVESTFDKY